MSAAGRFLRKMNGGYGHWCPGCDEMHFIAVERPLANGAQWSFNGDLEKPTFTPSVKISIPGAGENAVECCHYFIKAGQIEFCADSTHTLAGQILPLPPFPDQ